MVEFIKSNNRVLCGVFACFIALMLIMSIFTPVAFAAEDEVKIKPIDFTNLPFDSLPTERTCYIITKTSNGYAYRGLNSDSSKVEARKGAIGSFTYAGSVSGSQCCRYEFANGSWNLISNSNDSYEWFGFNDPTDIVYCSIPVYIVDGEEMTLVYPKPPAPQIPTVLGSVTGYSGSLFGLATQTINWVTANPLALICFIASLFGIGIMIFKALTKGV